MKVLISKMAINKHTIDRFITTYKLYYKKDPIITNREHDMFSVRGFAERLPIRSLSQIALFYAWRYKQGILHTEAFTKRDFAQLTHLLDKHWISRKGIGAALNVSTQTFTVHYAESLCVETAYYNALAKKKIKDPELITWQEKSMNADDWAIILGMTTQAFRTRKRKHGLHALTFMTKEEYKSIPKSERDKIIGPARESKDNNAQERFAIKSKRLNSASDISYKQALSLVAGIIEDSKDNLICGDLTKKRSALFRSSQRFLMNCNGQLKYYIEAIENINCDKALKELYNYAKFGYIKDQNEKTRKAIIKRDERLLRGKQMRKIKRTLQPSL